MRFMLSVLMVMGAVSLAACGHEDLQPAFKTEGTFDNGVMQSTPNFAQFREIPVPEKATMNLEKTLLFGSDPLIGRLAFKAPYNQANMFDFYMQEMPKFGWTELTSIRATQSYLMYAKDNRVATILLQPTATNGSEVMFDISMSKNRKGY